MPPRRKITAESLRRARRLASSAVKLIRIAERGVREDNPRGVRLCARKARECLIQCERELNGGFP